MTKRELKAIENDNARELIRYLYDEDNGYGTIARILNERGVLSLAPGEVSNIRTELRR